MANSPKWYWPAVDTRRNAGFAIEEAFWAASLVSVLTVFITVVFMTGSEAPAQNAFGFVDAAIFAGIAYGIRRRSRTAAVIALVLYVSNVVYAFIIVGPSLRLLPAFVTLAFVHGVRGTFAYHKFPALPANLPSVEQGFQALRQAPNQETQSPENQQPE
jgi:hypothetical protein